MRISDWSSDVCSSDLRTTDGEARCGAEDRLYFEPVDLHLIEIEHARPFDELHAKLIILIIIIEGRCVEGQQPVGDRGADARFIGPDRFGFHAGVLARHEIGEEIDVAALEALGNRPISKRIVAWAKQIGSASCKEKE